MVERTLGRAARTGEAEAWVAWDGGEAASVVAITVDAAAIAVWSMMTRSATAGAAPAARCFEGALAGSWREATAGAVLRATPSWPAAPRRVRLRRPRRRARVRPRGRPGAVRGARPGRRLNDARRRRPADADLASCMQNGPKSHESHLRPHAGHGSVRTSCRACRRPGHRPPPRGRTTSCAPRSSPATSCRASACARRRSPSASARRARPSARRSCAEADGLVDLEPHRGAVVRAFPADDLLDLYDVRALLESRAAALAAERVLPALFERLGELPHARRGPDGRGARRDRAADGLERGVPPARRRRRREPAPPRRDARGRGHPARLPRGVPDGRPPARRQPHVPPRDPRRARVGIGAERAETAMRLHVLSAKDFLIEVMRELD